MYSKPLASRMDSALEGQARAKRPITGAVNFASFLPQNGGQAPKVSPQGMGPQALLGMGGGQGSGQDQTPLEQAGAQSNLGLNQMRAMAALAATNAPKPGAAPESEAVKKFGLPLNPRDIFKLLTKASPDTEGAEMNVRVKSHRKGGNSKNRVAEAVTSTLNETLVALRQKSGANEGSPLGKLAAQFESGKEGVAAIGYDRHGGTSYGKYQISSRVGTMRSFINFLKTEAPDISEKLENTGPMNTGGKRGKMPDAWRQIAEENPERFEGLQDKFIRASHFEPAMRAIAEKTGMSPEGMPSTLQEVVFSTAVQHGPNGATRIISRALEQVGQNRLDPENSEPATLAKAQENLIRRIYDNRSGQFRSSTQTVQDAVKNRLKGEMSMALSMLRNERVGA